MLRTESVAVNRVFPTIKSARGLRARLITCLMVFIIGLLCTTSSVHAQGRDEVIFFFNDALGSAVAAVSEQGELCWSEDYTPYGDKTINDDVFSTRGCGVVGEERGFTGHTEDVNSDLVYMQQRYYDPSIGRFLSIDPLDAAPGKPQTLNRYAYANNNPYSYRDPDGQLPIAIVGIFAVGAVISAYDSYQAYKEGGVKALGETLAVEAAMAATGGGKLMMKAGKALKSVADSAEGVAKSRGKTFQTYTKTNAKDGRVYCGRTSGCGAPEQNIARRDANHRMSHDGYGPAVLDKSSTNSAAIRGREQQLIDAHGGAQSTGGTSGNRINGISNSNKRRDDYIDQANKEFGG